MLYFNYNELIYLYTCIILYDHKKSKLKSKKVSMVKKYTGQKKIVNINLKPIQNYNY